MASRADVVKKIMRLKHKLTDKAESATVDSLFVFLPMGVAVLLNICTDETLMIGVFFPPARGSCIKRLIELFVFFLVTDVRCHSWAVW